MRTNEPFGPEYIFRLASNDGSTHDAIQRHLSGIISAVGLACDMEYGSAANGMQVGSGYDVVVKRESDTTALVNVINLATKEEWLCETEVEADTDLQKLACQIGQCPSAELGGMPSDEDWDFCCDRWNAIKVK